MNILITGASSGIGKSLAELYAKNGNKVFISSRREEKLQSICNAINSKNGNCFYQKCDVSDINEVESMVKKAQEVLGSIDIAILNAGVGVSVKFSELNTQSYRKAYDVNFFGVLNAMEFLIPILKAQNGGKIAAVSSMADVRGIPSSSPYSTSKTALTKAMEAARIELKPYGINIVTIRPGFVETEMTEHQKGQMPLVMNSERAAKIIVKGLRKNHRYINFPLGMHIFTCIMGRIPNFVYEFILSKARMK